MVWPTHCGTRKVTRIAADPKSSTARSRHLRQPMQANDATLDEERRSAIAALLDCSADGQENRPPRQQRPHSRDNPVGSTSARSTLKLLQLPKRRPLTEGYSDNGNESKEPSATAVESPAVDEAGQASKATRRRAGRSEARMSPVAPLRCDHDVNVARLKLLGSKAKRLPLKARQYVYEPAPKTARHEARAISDGAGVNAIEVPIT